MLIGFIGLDTVKGGIFAHRDLNHEAGTRDQGTGNRKTGARDLRTRVVGWLMDLVVKELRTRVGAWAGKNARRTLGNSPYSCEYFKYGRFE